MVKVKEETCSVEDGAVFLVLPSGGGGKYTTINFSRKRRRDTYFLPGKKKHWGQLSETERGAFFTLGSIKTTVMT